MLKFAWRAGQSMAKSSGAGKVNAWHFKSHAITKLSLKSWIVPSYNHNHTNNLKQIHSLNFKISESLDNLCSPVSQTHKQNKQNMLSPSCIPWVFFMRATRCLLSSWIHSSIPLRPIPKSLRVIRVKRRSCCQRSPLLITKPLKK